MTVNDPSTEEHPQLLFIQRLLMLEEPLLSHLTAAFRHPLTGASAGGASIR